MKYESFDEFIFRCPSLPLNKSVSKDYSSDLFLEAIYLASPDLWDSIQKQSIFDKRVKISALKYLNRMKVRCTPFGLFAGIGIGRIGGPNGIHLGEFSENKNHIRLDMEFLCNLYDHFLKTLEDTGDIPLYVNSSLYKIAENYRYHEYFFKDGERLHNLVEIDGSAELDLVITTCTQGATGNILSSRLIDQGYDKEESNSFISTLLESQILVLEISPRLTGSDLLEELLLNIEKYKIDTKESSFIKELAIDIRKVNRLPIGKRHTSLSSIEKRIKDLKIPYKRKFLFQSDTFINPIKASLDTRIKELVSEGVKVLNALNIPFNNWPLENFRENFYSRYEEEEIPLAEALDPDIGVGFSQTVPGAADFNPLIEGIISTNYNNKEITNVGEIDLLLWRKYNESQKKGENFIVIHDKDLELLKINWHDLPETFAAIIEVINASNNDLSILIKSVIGSSAAKTFGRFTYLDKNLSDFVEKIYQQEKNIIGEDKILAEVIHLPEARTGNILFRSNSREYEIPYLGKSSVSGEYSIPISDLLVSVPKGKQIKLRSQKLNKEIIPRLTTAHNYNHNSLPIYQFLCLLQENEKRGSLNFQWGNLLNTLSFLPRVCYKNIILSPATWNFSNAALKKGIASENIFRTIIEFKNENRLPDQALLVNHDNKLLIDFTDLDSSEVFYNEVNGKPFILEEFLFDPQNSLIHKDQTSYRNEIIISYYKKIKDEY